MSGHRHGVGDDPPIRACIVDYFHVFESKESTHHLSLTILHSFVSEQMSERLVNYNKRLFGPGPVARLPASGLRGYYARMPPLQGFCMAAAHGAAMGFAVAATYKFTMGNPDTKLIEEYYKENPPR